MFDIDFDGSKRFLYIEPNTKAASVLVDVASEFMMNKLADINTSAFKLPISMSEVRILLDAGILKLSPVSEFWHTESSWKVEGTPLLAEWINIIQSGESIEHFF